MMILEFIGVVVLILLTMVSYASGITLAARRRDYSPVVLDLLVIGGLWLVVFWLRPQLARLVLLPIVIGSGVMVGYVLGTARLADQDTAVIIPESELPEHAREKGPTAVKQNLLKRGWARWTDFAGRMGNVQGRLLMGFFYFFVVTPFGLPARLFTDSLAIRHTPEQSNWRAKDADDLTLETAKEQG